MKKPVLVVMAAGMGSRYGGMKQIDPVGPNGQVIVDYSLYDARRAGFETVIFVIKHEIEDAFKAAIGERVSKAMQVKYAFQADYGTMTYDLALSLTENGELKGYDVQLRVSTYLSNPLGHQLEEVPITFRGGEAQVQLEGLPFGYHKLVGVSLVYTKGELEGQQSLLLLEPTGRGISWLVEDGSPEGGAPLPIEENSELLAAP